MEFTTDKKPLSVTELTAGIKKLLEQNYTGIEVCGEVSRLTRHASGHMYFTIKDKHASISAVIWRSTALRLKLQPEEGEEFIFTGSISVYEPRGTYQLVVRKVEAAGAGQLAIEFERRKAAFAKRGWFDAARKSTPPELPKHIGVVSSPTSAAFEDVKKVLSTRPTWLKITLAPATMQGDQAASSIASAISRLNDMDDRPDTIVLTRGGGSVEDLWCFNDEQVVRAVVESDIPVISGIGHEIDTTLADLAADVRAATPSNAAELACPDRDTLRNRLPRLSLLQTLVVHQMDISRRQHSEQFTALKLNCQRSQDNRFQHSERALGRLFEYFKAGIEQRHRLLNQSRHRLAQQEPRTRLRRHQKMLQHCQQHLTTFQMHGTNSQHNLVMHYGQRLIWLGSQHIEMRKQQLINLQRQLEDLGPVQVLKRGYSMSTDKNAHLISSVSQLHANDTINIHFHDGHALAKTISVSKDKI